MQTVAQQVIQAIWLRHPNNWRVNELLDEGIKGMEMAMHCSDNSSLQPALASFEEAASLDPTHPETWNKIAAVLFLTQQCVFYPLMLLCHTNMKVQESWQSASMKVATCR